MVKIIDDKNNELLKRREIKIIAEAEKNPGMQETSKMISEQFKTEEDKIAVKGIKGKFGRNTFLISAFIYQTKEARDKIEPKIKEKEKKEEKKPEQSAEQPKE